MPNLCFQRTGKLGHSWTSMWILRHELLNERYLKNFPNVEARTDMETRQNLIQHHIKKLEEARNNSEAGEGCLETMATCRRESGASDSGTRLGCNVFFLVRRSLDGVQKFYIGFDFCLGLFRYLVSDSFMFPRQKKGVTHWCQFLSSKYAVQ